MDKVFCNGCKYKDGHWCKAHPYYETKYDKVHTYYYWCSDLNGRNDCQRYKPTVWKMILDYFDLNKRITDAS